jgi:hypothetical protein
MVAEPPASAHAARSRSRPDGKLRLDEPALDFLTREIACNNFELLSISLVHATAMELCGCGKFIRLPAVNLQECERFLQK